MVGLRHVQGQGAAELSVVPSAGRSSDAQPFLLSTHRCRQRPRVGRLPSVARQSKAQSRLKPGSVPGLQCLLFSGSPALRLPGRPSASLRTGHIF